MDEIDRENFDSFLKRSRALKQSIACELASGHDRLIELGAPAAKIASSLIHDIQAADSDPRFEKFVIRLFDQLGLDVSDLITRSYHFHRGQRHSEAFAGLPPEGLSATFDRTTALAREDLAFLTPDHPVFRSALEQFLDGESGNSSFALWKTGKGKAVLLECAFVIEVLAPTRLHLDRFLPPTIIRVMVDHQGRPVVNHPPSAVLQAGDPRRLVSQETFRRELFPKMLDAARSLATTASESTMQSARDHAAETLGNDLARLEDLATRNPQVSPAELAALGSLRDVTLAALKTPRVRLDALRLIWRE